MRRLSFLFIIALSAALFSCSKENVGVSPKTISATYCTDATKTFLDADGAKVLWDERDSIMIFKGGTSACFVSQSPAGSATAQFGAEDQAAEAFWEELQKGGESHALYPWSSSATCEGGTFSISLPARQTAKEGSFARNAAISLAVSTSTSYSFYNLCGGIRFSLKEEGIRSVSVKGAKGESLAGGIKAAFSEGRPTVSQIDEGAAEVTLTAPDGSTFQTGKWYYMMLLPAQLADGFTMSFNKGDSNASHSTSKTVEIRRSVFLSIENADEGIDFKEVVPIILDEGEKPSQGAPVSPKYPDLEHTVEYSEFFDPYQDYLDEYGNVDYVIAQGNGTAWPIITDDYMIRLYQGSSASKGGSYIRVRAKNGAKLIDVTFGSATATKYAYSVSGKAKKSATADLAAGATARLEVEGESEVCIYCMGTSSKERLHLNYLKVHYKGGFVDEDFYVEPKEYGPLVQLPFPYTQSFESGAFPTTEKPSYYKYGITAGPDSLQWKTWFGSFSWQNPIEGGQSAQLRVYQEDEEYDGEQFGYLQTEFFIHDLASVSFKYWMSEYWLRATISWCKFGETQWRNAEQIALTEYSQRETVRDFTYVLDEGRPCDAKIRIEIDPATGHPSKDHYDLILDGFVFDTVK